MLKVARCLVLAMSLVCACSLHHESNRVDPKPAVTSVVEVSAPRSSTSPGLAFHAIVGCWKLADSERWSIQPTPRGTEVTRTLLNETERALGDYATRASQPSKVTFDEKQQAYAFVTAGRIHAQLFSFIMVEQSSKVAGP